MFVFYQMPTACFQLKPTKTMVNKLPLICKTIFQTWLISEVRLTTHSPQEIMLQGKVLARLEKVNSSNCQRKILYELVGNIMQLLQMAHFRALHRIGGRDEITTKEGGTVTSQYMKDTVFKA